MKLLFLLLFMVNVIFSALYLFGIIGEYGWINIAGAIVLGLFLVKNK